MQLMKVFRPKIWLEVEEVFLFFFSLDDQSLVANFHMYHPELQTWQGVPRFVSKTAGGE